LQENNQHYRAIYFHVKYVGKLIVFYFVHAESDYQTKSRRIIKLGCHCDVCDVAIRAGSNMDERDAGQIHKALKNALSHMTVKEFLQF
jgi:hypothetical protein